MCWSSYKEHQRQHTKLDVSSLRWMTHSNILHVRTKNSTRQIEMSSMDVLVPRLIIFNSALFCVCHDEIIVTESEYRTSTFIATPIRNQFVVARITRSSNIHFSLEYRSSIIMCVLCSVVVAVDPVHPSVHRAWFSNSKVLIPSKFSHARSITIHTHTTLSHTFRWLSFYRLSFDFLVERGNWMLTTIAVVVATADAAGRAAGKAELNWITPKCVHNWWPQYMPSPSSSWIIWIFSKRTTFGLAQW